MLAVLLLAIGELDGVSDTLENKGKLRQSSQAAGQTVFTPGGSQNSDGNTGQFPSHLPSQRYV